MASAAETKPAGDWKFLQKRVFARWLNNKLLARQKNESEPVKITKITEENILTCWNTGHQLVALIEVLSKKDCPYKKQMRTDFKMKIQQIENINYALKFCWEGGVQLELHPSAENILDGDERMVMGLIWGIMRSFLNFGFDDERLSVADALLKWVRGQISPYPQLSVNNFTTHWHNGLIFAALIHRYRPDLIGDFNALDRAEGEKNLTLALAGAEKWFGLDQYITPADIPILDDKSMIIYVSEWYTGITSFGKSIMAAQRIAKIIDYTVENDKIKEDYTNRAKAWRAKVEPLIKQLDEPIGSDDSLDSIRSKLDSFEKYQTGEKPKLLAEHLDLESILSYLQIRLADSNHPIWVPEEGIRLADLRQLAEQLDAIEAKRNAALRNELNRQLKLLELSSEHESLYSQIQAYLSSKNAQVAAKNEVNTVSIGEFQLNTLQTLLSEVQALQGSDVSELQTIGKKLAEANFSGMSIVHQREAAVDDALNNVRNAAASKAKFLEDTIAVLSFKDNLELLVSAHASKADALQAWCAQHKSNLQSLVDSLQNNLSIASAKRAVYSLKVLNTDRADKIRTDVAALKKAGAEITGAQLDSQFSGTITYTDAAVISAREDDISHEFQSLDQLSAQKESQLNAILSSEQQKDKLRLDYANLAAAFVRFVESAVERANSQKLWGRTIAEVTSNAPGDEVLTEANAKFEAAQKAHAATPQSENPYTALTVADLQAAQSKLVAAFSSRKQRYDAELSAITEQDAVFKAFAEIAVPFIKQLQLAKEEITNSAEPLDKQLTDVQARLEAAENSSDVNAISGFHGKLGGQTSYNPYTPITIEECVTTFTQFKSFLQSKQKALNEQIEASKNRGITQEQLAEWLAMFKDSDKDNSGWLSSDEFRSVLFALGEKRKPEEINALMEEYGNAEKHIDFDGFKRFMVKINGQSLSKEEITNSFDLLNKNEPHLNLEATHIQTAIPKNAREYLARNAPKTESGEVDIKKFIDDLFSR